MDRMTFIPCYIWWAKPTLRDKIFAMSGFILLNEGLVDAKVKK